MVKSVRNPYKTMYRGTSARKKDGMHRPEGAGNFDNMDDDNFTKSINVLQGTIQHTPTLDKHILNKEYVHAGNILLNEIGNPGGNTTFTMSNKLLAFRYTAPTPAGAFEGAFEVEAIGGFTGNLVHIHQHTGNPGAGTVLLDVEASDTDVTVAQFRHTGNVSVLRLLGPDAFTSGARVNYGDSQFIFLEEDVDDRFRIHAATRLWVDTPITGINIANPSNTLDVNGTFRARGESFQIHLANQPVRALNTTYRNLTGHPIKVYGSVNCGVNLGGDTAFADVKTDANTPPATIKETVGWTVYNEFAGGTQVNTNHSFEMIVQDQHYYRVDTTTAGGGTVALNPANWNEVDF